MSPILVRPVREQLEHDRIIRLLHGKFRRKYEAGMNPGAEQNAAVGSGPSALYPDLVLLSPDRGHRLQVVVEVETGESVNHLEALAQWAHYAKDARGVPPLRARGHGRRGAPALRGQPHPRRRNLELPRRRRRAALHAGASQSRSATPAAAQAPVPGAPRAAPTATAASRLRLAPNRRPPRRAPKPARASKPEAGQARQKKRKPAAARPKPRRPRPRKRDSWLFLQVHARQTRLRAFLSRAADDEPARQGAAARALLVSDAAGHQGGTRTVRRSVRRALEAQNPDITFDWRAILETPIPSADADKWRERRRAERAARNTRPLPRKSAEAVAATSADDASRARRAPEPPDRRRGTAAVDRRAAPIAALPAPRNDAPTAAATAANRRRRPGGGGARRTSPPARRRRTRAPPPNRRPFRRLTASKPGRCSASASPRRSWPSGCCCGGRGDRSRRAC